MAKTLRMVRRVYQLAAGATVVGLAPADPYSEEILADLFDGETYSVDVKQDRRRGDINLYWAGIGLLVKNYSGVDPAFIRLGAREVDASRIWPTSRKYHDMLMSATGHVTRPWRIDGTFREDVDSIALDNMEQDEFKAYFERARAITHALFGYDPWDAWKDEATERRVAKYRAPKERTAP